MRRPIGPGVATLALLVAGTAARAQQSVFRATTDVVQVRASVRNGDKLVAALSAADFAVLDNGVPQHIESADLAAAPVDLTAIVDLGFLAHLADADNFRDAVKKLCRVLAPTDRLRVLAAATDIDEVLPWGPPVDRPIASPTEGFGASIDDALLDALVWPAAEDRRDVVVLLTRGTDSGSVLRWDALPGIAERSDATLELVLVPLRISTGEAIPPYPVPTAMRNALIDAAARTGGDVFYIADAVSGVKHALEDVRQSYTLRYTLTGVAKPGWHDVTVKVTKPGSSGYKVRARKGYFVVSSAPSATNSLSIRTTSTLRGD